MPAGLLLQGRRVVGVPRREMGQEEAAYPRPVRDGGGFGGRAVLRVPSAVRLLFAEGGLMDEDVEIGLGCVSCLPGEVDSAETIVDRVEQALHHVAPQRITLNPECGFAPGSAAVVSIDEVYTKLKNEVRAAQRLREKYG